MPLSGHKFLGQELRGLSTKEEKLVRCHQNKNWEAEGIVQVVETNKFKALGSISSTKKEKEKKKKKRKTHPSTLL
jgi:hypothetical protein